MDIDARINQWFVQNDEHKLGPLSYASLLESIRQGAVQPHSLLWAPGFDTWVPAASVDGLFSPPGASTSASVVPSDRSAASLITSAILRDDMLDRFIGGSAKRKAYYKRVFGQFIQNAGLDGKPLADVNLRKVGKLSRSGKGRFQFLPFRKDTTFNWAAFFFNGYWLLWRKTAWRWTVFTALCLTIVLGPVIPAAANLAIALAFMVGAYGNQFLFQQLLKELKQGTPREKSTRPVTVLLAVIIIAIVAVAAAALETAGAG